MAWFVHRLARRVCAAAALLPALLPALHAAAFAQSGVGWAGVLPWPTATAGRSS